jgi:FkbH-like protein
MTTINTHQQQDTERFDEITVFNHSRQLRKENKHDEALSTLRNAMRRHWLSAEGIEKAGRQIIKHFKTHSTQTQNILVLGQCTTNWLCNCLTASAYAGGMSILATEGQYDNVMQELMAAASNDVKYDAVVLLPWNTRLLADGDRNTQQRIDDEIAFWQQAWNFVNGQLNTRLIQIGYDYKSPGYQGHHLGGQAGGHINLVRQINEALRAKLPEMSFFVDLDQISGMIGRENFYDARRYYWTKQPFSEVGTARLSEHVFAAYRTMVNGPKKVLILDLDNTVWGGVVGETGPLGIGIGDSPDGEAHRALQRYAKSLQNKGILLAVCSKNNDADAREPFEKNPDMILKLEDFAAFEASWDPKAVAIHRIAQTLRLGLDSFVFLDDNPVEREHVRQMLPDVEVVEVGDDASEYVHALEHGLWFESMNVTKADAQRVEQYRAEAQRREVQSSFTSMDDYLESLKMSADARQINEEDFTRVIQLLGKTNQFNLTTRRHSPQLVEQMLVDKNNMGITLRVADRFGDHGLVAVLLAVLKDHPMGTPGKAFEIDTWLMSCRVIGRTVEEFCYNTLLNAARDRNADFVIGTYIPTAKNALVKDLYDRLGFTPIHTADDGTVTYELNVHNAEERKTFLAKVVADA